jgi:REP element-mobilizing transposase RayT
MRDFKRFTSRTIHDRLKEDGRSTILDWLERGTEKARRDRDELGLWQSGFHPQAITTHHFFAQKLNYLHDNPVRKGLVLRADDWWYSSAANYLGRDLTCMDVDVLEI